MFLSLFMILDDIISLKVVDDGSNAGPSEELLLVVTSCFPANIIPRSKIFEIVRSPSLIIFCFKFMLSCKSSNEFCKFKVLEIDRSLLFIIFCFVLIAVST